MSAVILAFPSRSPIQALTRSGDGSAPFTAAWCAHHLPLIQAAMDLLEATDDEFARRCALMRDEGGRAMLDELAGQLQRLGAHIADVADALGLTAERIRDAMVAGLRPARGRPWCVGALVMRHACDGDRVHPKGRPFTACIRM